MMLYVFYLKIRLIFREKTERERARVAGLKQSVARVGQEAGLASGLEMDARIGRAPQMERSGEGTRSFPSRGPIGGLFSDLRCFLLLPLSFGDKSPLIL